MSILIKGGQIITAEDDFVGDVLIEGETIAAVGGALDVDALDAAASLAGEPYMRMTSGAAHDTMCVADLTRTAMVFIPCRDGISHSPDEQADPGDAALGAEVILNAVGALTGQ
jgi:acetylornithine deacetylase/succinyl-diaminopimelate desuccinylase-like protein